MNTPDPVDLEQIRALTNVYALGLDTFDVGLATSVFTTNARFDATAFGVHVIAGRAKIAEFLLSHQETVQSQMHLVSNQIISPEGPDSAGGTSYLLEESRAIATGELSRLNALYTDSYVRISDSSWRIESRKVDLLLNR
jgi:hypothetical protein